MGDRNSSHSTDSNSGRSKNTVNSRSSSRRRQYRGSTTNRRDHQSSFRHRRQSSSSSSHKMMAGKLSLDQVDQIINILQAFLSSCNHDGSATSSSSTNSTTGKNTTSASAGGTTSSSSSSRKKQAPASLIAQIHTNIGLLQARQENFQSAIDHLVKALWMLRTTTTTTTTIRTSSQQQNKTSSSSYSDHMMIGLTSHRLAIMYGLSLQYNQAASLLERAIQHYNGTPTMISSKEDHPLIISAKQSLETYRRMSNATTATSRSSSM